MKFIFLSFYLFCFTSAFAQKQNDMAMRAAYASVQNKLFRLTSSDQSIREKQDEQFATIADFILQYPRTDNGFYLINLFINGRLPQLDSLLKMVDTSLNKSPFRNLAVVTRNRVAVTETGKKFPSLLLKDSSGIFTNTDSLKGKLVLLEFWSSWCVPCRRQMPELKKIYADFAPNNFEILGISFDHVKTDWKNAIVKDKLSWPQYCDLVQWSQNKIASRFSINSIPANYLLDKNGIILGQDLAPHQVRRILNKKD